MVSRRKDVECHQCGNAQMRLTNLDLEKYTSMSEQDRISYADDSNGGKVQWRKPGKHSGQQEKLPII